MIQQLPIEPEWGTLYALGIPETQKRMQHETAHQLLQESLPAYGTLCGIAIPGSPPALSFGKMGKPSLTDYPDIHFNLSHCNGLAVCLFSDTACGVDCEGIRIYKSRVAQRVCTPEELTALEHAADRDFLFTRLWTLKEAYVKAIGIGISYPMRELGFVLDGDRIVSNRKDASFLQLLLSTHIVSVCVLKPMKTQCVIKIE